MSYKQSIVKTVDSTRLSAIRASSPEGYDPKVIDEDIKNSNLDRISNVVGCTHDYFDPLLQNAQNKTPNEIDQSKQPDPYTLYVVNTPQPIKDPEDEPYYSDLYYGSRKISDIQIVTSAQAGDDVSDTEQDGEAPDGKLYIVINTGINTSEAESHPEPTISRVLYKYQYYLPNGESESKYLPIVSNIFKKIDYESESDCLILTLEDNTICRIPCLNEDGLFSPGVMQTLDKKFHPKWYEFNN